MGSSSYNSEYKHASSKLPFSLDVISLVRTENIVGVLCATNAGYAAMSDFAHYFPGASIACLNMGATCLRLFLTFA